LYFFRIMESSLYIHYRFLGLRSFPEMLDESGTPYHIFEDDLSTLYEHRSGILKKDEDSVLTGVIRKKGEEAFFGQFALKITPSFRTHIVFIFDHHPTLEDMEGIVNILPDLVARELENVDLSRLADLTRPPGGNRH
jgi:hypothetical protein